LDAAVGPSREAPLAPRISGVPVPREVVVAEIDRRLEAAAAELAGMGLAYHKG
jgi:hypothetical protein